MFRCEFTQTDAASMATNLSKQKENIPPSKIHSLVLSKIAGIHETPSRPVRLFGWGARNLPMEQAQGEVLYNKRCIRMDKCSLI